MVVVCDGNSVACDTVFTSCMCRVTVCVCGVYTTITGICTLPLIVELAIINTWSTVCRDYIKITPNLLSNRSIRVIHTPFVITTNITRFTQIT